MVHGDVAKGNSDKKELRQKEHDACPTMGACPLMGTANTMQILIEVLGLTLPGTSTIPEVFTDKFVSARRTSRRVVEMVHENLRTGNIVTRKSLENAITMDMAIGGSTRGLAIFSKVIVGSAAPITFTAVELTKDAWFPP